MKKTGDIYALADPHTGRTRYVGKTTLPVEERYAQHIRATIKMRRYSRLYRWMRTLTQPPTMRVILRAVPVNILSQAEKDSILCLKVLGAELLNSTSGGDGGDTFSGRRHTEEAKIKIGEANKNSKRPDLSTRNRESPPMKGRHHSKESKARISCSHMGMVKPWVSEFNSRDSTREKRREAALKQWREKRDLMLVSLNRRRP